MERDSGMTREPSLISAIRLGIRNGLKLSSINGHINHWCLTYGTTSETFKTIWEREELAYLSEASTKPSEVVDDE